ncbi:MAG: sulfotransferase [Myxococcota bacterium]
MSFLDAWKPPARPAWVEHLNAMADAVGGPARLVSLDSDELIESATDSTGYTDFGPDTWRRHYDILVGSINGQASLHAAGRLLTRSEIVRCLRNRLFVEAYLEAHPEALETPVREPVMICGYGRSGTSITQELFGCDPSMRAPLATDLFNVSPLAEGESRSERVRFADGEQRYYDDVVPEYTAMHENGAELPVECLMFQMHEFLSANFFGTLDVPDYLMHAMTTDWRSAYRYQYRMLQVMQHQRPGQRWVLKGPTHQDRLEVLFEVFPDAKVVQLHRDPRKMIPSSFSLLGTLRWMRSDQVDLSALAFVPVTMKTTLERVITQRENADIPGDQIYDLLYADLVNDPAAAVRRAYAHHGLDFGAGQGGRIVAYLKAKPKGKHGSHRYTLEEFGLDSEQLGEMFRDYQTHYGVPEESDP